MLLSLQHPSSKVRLAKFSELTERLRRFNCAQDRSGAWTPAAKVEKVVGSWAREFGYTVATQDHLLVVKL